MSSTQVRFVIPIVLQINEDMMMTIQQTTKNISSSQHTFLRYARSKSNWTKFWRATSWHLVHQRRTLQKTDQTNKLWG